MLILLHPLQRQKDLKMGDDSSDTSPPRRRRMDSPDTSPLSVRDRVYAEAAAQPDGCPTMHLTDRTGPLHRSPNCCIALPAASLSPTCCIALPTRCTPVPAASRSYTASCSDPCVWAAFFQLLRSDAYRRELFERSPLVVSVSSGLVELPLDTILSAGHAYDRDKTGNQQL